MLTSLSHPSPHITCFSHTFDLLLTFFSSFFISLHLSSFSSRRVCYSCVAVGATLVDVKIDDWMWCDLSTDAGRTRYFSKHSTCLIACLQCSRCFRIRLLIRCCLGYFALSALRICLCPLQCNHPTLNFPQLEIRIQHSCWLISYKLLKMS